MYPGSHWGLQEAVIQQVKSESNLFSDVSERIGTSPVGSNNNARDGERSNNGVGLPGTPSGIKPDLGPATQLLMKKGDVCVAHQKLPHRGMMNYSCDTRYQVYFRISNIGFDEGMKEKWLEDLMLPFEGVKEAFPGI